MDSEDETIFAIWIFLGVAGGLLGFGLYGTAQAAAIFAAVGLILPVVLILGVLLS